MMAIKNFVFLRGFCIMFSYIKMLNSTVNILFLLYLIIYLDKLWLYKVNWYVFLSFMIISFLHEVFLLFKNIFHIIMLYEKQYYFFQNVKRYLEIPILICLYIYILAFTKFPLWFLYFAVPNMIVFGLNIYYRVCLKALAQFEVETVDAVTESNEIALMEIRPNHI